MSGASGTGHDEIDARRLAAGEQIVEHLRTPWEPSVTDPRDAFLQPAYTVADDSITALAEPAGVFVPGREPGGSEFSWGKGLMAPPELAPPTPFEAEQAIRRTNPADPGATLDYESTDHSHSAVENGGGTYIARVRDTETDIGKMP